MTTAETLEELTDSGEFETLCLRVLRGIEDDCKAVIHMVSVSYLEAPRTAM